MLWQTRCSTIQASPVVAVESYAIRGALKAKRRNRRLTARSGPLTFRTADIRFVIAVTIKVRSTMNPKAQLRSRPALRDSVACLLAVSLRSAAGQQVVVCSRSRAVFRTPSAILPESIA
jgi:hypothetical protein